MDGEQVFINCVAEDIPFGQAIKSHLEGEGIGCYLPTNTLDPTTNREMVGKIKTISAQNGVMVSLLSRKSSQEHLLISNVQLMSELSQKRTSLVAVQIEDIPNDENTRLFFSQAILIKAGRQSLEKVLPRVAASVKRLTVGHSPSIFRPSQIPVRWIRGLIITVAAASLVAVIGYNRFFPFQASPAGPTPIPVVMYVPFSGQSKDVGLIVDVRSVPAYQAQGDPAAERPFSFTPAYVYQREDYKDPQFENVTPLQDWTENGDSLVDVESLAFNQTHGVLQAAVAPQPKRKVSFHLGSNYMIQPDVLTYVGIRFRLEDYQGVVSENTQIHVDMQYERLNNSVTFFNADLVNQIFNGTSQSGNLDIALGSQWHTVEVIRQPLALTTEIYLDGKNVSSFSNDNLALISLTKISINIAVENTTDWARWQIDEIVYGGDHPMTPRSTPADAAYRFTPDKVFYHIDFNTPVDPQYQFSGAQFAKYQPGVLVFNFPKGKDTTNLDLNFPARPLNEMNYFAARFRYTTPNNDYWSLWGSIRLGLGNKDFMPPGGYLLQVMANKQNDGFGGQSGMTSIGGFQGSNANFAPGSWHTLEMVVTAPQPGQQDFLVSFWVDGYQINQATVENVDKFLDPQAQLFAYLSVSGGVFAEGGILRNELFSGEIDDLILGSVHP